MKTILITGGTGFIGRHLSTEASARGWQVVVLTRDTVAAARRLPAEVRLIESLDRLGDDQAVDAVVNLAGEPLAAGRWTEASEAKNLSVVGWQPPRPYISFSLPESSNPRCWSVARQ